MTNEMALWLALGSALVAIIYGLLTTTWVLGKDAGSEKMQKIAAAVQEGAKAYMNRQYSTIGIVGVVLFVVVGFLLDWATAIGFANAGPHMVGPVVARAGFQIAVVVADTFHDPVLQGR